MTIEAGGWTLSQEEDTTLVLDANGEPIAVILDTSQRAMQDVARAIKTLPEALSLMNEQVTAIRNKDRMKGMMSATAMARHLVEIYDGPWP